MIENVRTDTKRYIIYKNTIFKINLGQIIA